LEFGKDRGVNLRASDNGNRKPRDALKEEPLEETRIVKKPAVRGVKAFATGLACMFGLGLAACGETTVLPVPEGQAPIVNVKVYVPSDKQDGGVIKDVGIQDAGTADAGTIEKTKYCPDKSKVDFAEEKGNVVTLKATDSKNYSYAAMDNGIIVSVGGYNSDTNTYNATDGKVTLVLKQDDLNLKLVELNEGDQISVTSSSGNSSALEVCSVITDSQFAKVLVTVASDKDFKQICDMSVHASTYYTIRNCSIPESAINMAQSGTLYAGDGKGLTMQDGNIILLKDAFIDKATGEAKMIVQITDKDGKILTEKDLSVSADCFNDIAVGSTTYKIYANAINFIGCQAWVYLGVVSSIDKCWIGDYMPLDEAEYPFGTLDGNSEHLATSWRQVGSEDSSLCADQKLVVKHEATFKYAIPLGTYSDRQKVMYLDHELILSMADENRVELLEESIHGVLNQGESLPLDNGTRIVLDDLVPANGQRADAAALSVLDANGNVLAKGEVAVNDGVAQIGNSNIYVRVYEAAPGYTFGTKWANIAVVKNVVNIRNGETQENGPSSGWDRTITTTVKTSNGGLEGWVLDVKNVWTDN
jgi:uncharacterized Zn ribbon protein